MFLPFCRMVWMLQGKDFNAYSDGWRFKSHSREGIHQIMCTTEQ